MQTDWFSDYILSWSRKVSWSEGELQKASNILYEICKVNGGEIVDNEELKPNDQKEYALEQISNVLQRRATSISHCITCNEKARFQVTGRADRKMPLNCICSSYWSEVVNINTASPRLLATLPGVGLKLGKRIAESRRNFGAFRKLTDLLRIKDVTEQLIESMQGRVCVEECGLSEENPLSTFHKKPSFEAYVELIAGSVPSPSATILEELIKALQEVRAIPARWWKYEAHSPANYAVERLDTISKAKKLENSGSGSIDAVAVITGRDYMELMGELLRGARTSIAVSMLFAKYTHHKSYPINALIDEVISAHHRGVDVRVLLDKDAPGGRVKSRRVNEHAYKALAEKGVPVIFSARRPRNHAKIVLVDDIHAVNGSHNWTARSIYRLHDTSMYVASADITKELKKVFDQWWSEARNASEKSKGKQSQK